MVSPDVLSWVSQYGYGLLALLVFLESVGLPVPGETSVLAAAFAAAQGVLSLPAVIVVAAVAGIAGDNLGYHLGYRFGRRWAERWGRWVLLTPTRLASMDAFFARYGSAAIVIARFVTGVRVVAAVAAGAAAMPRGRFVTFNILGAVTWAAAVGAIGFAMGRGYSAAMLSSGHVAVAPLVIAGSALFALWVARRLMVLLRARSGASWPEQAQDLLRRLGRHALAALVVSAGATLAFAKVTEDVVAHESTGFDHAVRSWVQGVRGPWLEAWAGGITLLGSGPVLIPLCVAGAVALWRFRGRRAAVAAMLAPAAAGGAIIAVKLLVHRARPAGAAGLGEAGYAFPSGHSTATAAVYLMLAYLLIRERLAPAWTAWVATVVVLLVGVSRVVLDVHWATDVLGGWSVGLAIAAAAGLVYERIRMAGNLPGAA